MDEKAVVESVKAWMTVFVIGENLCPFAARELDNDRVRFAVTASRREEELLAVMVDELDVLTADPSIETTLLIHPQVLEDFLAYNQFLDTADALLRELGLEGAFQIASFHPHYQFTGTAPEDAENYSNRSPFPLLHLLREESVEKAVAGFEGIEEVPERNIRQLREIGASKLLMRWRSCLPD